MGDGQVTGKLLLDKSDLKRALKSAEGDVRKFYSTLEQKAASAARKTSAYNKKMERDSKRATKSMKEGWWQKFGTIALGFTIAYRAMNAFEAVLSRTSRTIGEAIRESGVLAETQAKLAMWYKLHSKEVIDYGVAYSRAAVNVEALRQASIYSISSLEELAIGLDEISQTIGGISADSMKDMAAVVDFTVMVAQTTGSTTRQIRQEFQALMDGRIRTTDQLARSLKKIGALTEEDLANLRNMTNQAEILAKVFRVIAEVQREANKMILLGSIELSMKFWDKSIRNMIINAVKAKSELEGVQNIFAKTFFEHGENFMKSFSADDLQRFMILMDQLNWILDKALTAFEDTVKSISKLATAIDNVSPRVLALAKMFGSLLILELVVVSIKATSKMLAVFAVGTTAKVALIAAGILVLAAASKTLYDVLVEKFNIFTTNAVKWYDEYMRQTNKVDVFVANLAYATSDFLLDMSVSIGRFMKRIALETYDYWKAKFTDLMEFLSSKLSIFSHIPFLGDVIEGLSGLNDLIELINKNVSFERKELATGLSFVELQKREDTFRKGSTEGWKNYFSDLKNNYLGIGEFLFNTIKADLAKSDGNLFEIFTNWSPDFRRKFKANIYSLVDLSKGAVKKALESLIGLVEDSFTPKIDTSGWAQELAEHKALYGSLEGLGTPKRGIEGPSQADIDEIREKLREDARKARQKADEAYYVQVIKYEEQLLTLFLSQRDALIALAESRFTSAQDLKIILKQFDLDEFTTRYEKMRDGWKDAIMSMTDYWIDFLKTGEFQFGNFITSVLEQIARLVIAEYLVKPLADTLSRIMGGFFSLGFSGGGGTRSINLEPPPIMGLAKGGILPGPTYFPGANAMGGEAGPEALLPLSRLSGGKLGVGVGGMFNVSIINNTGAEVSQSEKSNRMGGRDLSVVIGKAMGQDVMDGGPLSKALRTAYGLRPSLVGR